eukprot:scaffold110464_cov36-Phaeocystis_antarctica.AAC.1
MRLQQKSATETDEMPQLRFFFCLGWTPNAVSGSTQPSSLLRRGPHIHCPTSISKSGAPLGPEDVTGRGPTQEGSQPGPRLDRKARARKDPTAQGGFAFERF